MSGETNHHPFRIDTESVPEGVDDRLAAERNRLIDLYRAREMTAEDTHFKLLQLYWQTQQSTNGETSVYLMEVSYMFPVEAEMSPDTAEEIYQAAQRSAHREQAAAEAAQWPTLYM